MGLSIERECRRCHRSNRWSSDLEIEESIQVGCQYCQKPKTPQYHTEYNSGSNVWVIFKCYYKPMKSWFGLGPIKEYLVDEVLRVNHEYNFDDDNTKSKYKSPELEFNTLKEAKDYIKRLEGK